MMLGLTGVRTVWHVVRRDGTVVRWASGRDGSIVRTADREPKSLIFHAVQSLLRVLWIAESLLKQYLSITKWFCPEWGQNTNNQVLCFFLELLDIITLFTLVFLRHLGRVIYVWFFSLLCFTLCPVVTKRGSNFLFGPELYFYPVKWFLSQNGQRGILLVCDWLHSVGQNYFYVIIHLNRDSSIQSSSRRFCTVYKSVKSDPLQLSRRRDIPFGRPTVQSIIRPDDENFLSGLSSMSRSFDLFQLASVQTF